MAAAEEWGTVLEPVDWVAKQLQPFQRCFLPDARTSDGGSSATVDGQRAELDVVIEDAAGGHVPAPVATFEELRVLPEYVLQGLRQHGIVAPMPIQAQALPLVLSGRDVVGLAQTGSGKTLAFLLPAVVHIEAQPPLERWAPTPIVLVLAPTRELAVQISDEAMKILRKSKEGNHRRGVWAVCLYGGGNKREQIKNLSWGSHIIVATPGRLIDFINTGNVSLADRVSYLVLDEADRMLDLGFSGDMASISAQVRPDRQVLFFSATWSRSVQDLARGLCHEGSRPVRIAVGQKKGQRAAVAEGDEGNQPAHQARESILQEVVVVDFLDDWQKAADNKRMLLDKYLDQILQLSPEHKVLVFVSQKVLADELCDKLWEAGYKVGAMHGGKAQESRLAMLDRFRKGEIRLLVATDVLGRGIDIPSVSHVVVFEMGSLEDYIHRIGRTARGKNSKGCALVFFEYYWKEPQIAAEFIGVLEAAKQPVPDGLRQIAEEVRLGKRSVWDPQANWGRGAKKAGTVDEPVGVDGDWDRHLQPEAIVVPEEQPRDASPERDQYQSRSWNNDRRNDRWKKDRNGWDRSRGGAEEGAADESSENRQQESEAAAVQDDRRSAAGSEQGSNQSRGLDRDRRRNDRRNNERISWNGGDAQEVVAEDSSGSRLLASDANAVADDGWDDAGSEPASSASRGLDRDRRRNDRQRNDRNGWNRSRGDAQEVVVEESSESRPLASDANAVQGDGWGDAGSEPASSAPRGWDRNRRRNDRQRNDRNGWNRSRGDAEEVPVEDSMESRQPDTEADAVPEDRRSAVGSEQGSTASRGRDRDRRINDRSNNDRNGWNRSGGRGSNRARSDGYGQAESRTESTNGGDSLRPLGAAHSSPSRQVAGSEAVGTWLNNLWDAGELEGYITAFDTKGVQTVDDVITEYAPNGDFAADRFFDEIGVKKPGHRGIFRAFFRGQLSSW